MQSDRAWSAVAALVGLVSAIWYYHDVAVVTASPDPHFPLLPALIAAPSVVLALYLGTRSESTG